MAYVQYLDRCHSSHLRLDWSVIQLEKPIPYIWIKAVRRLDAIEIFYSFDDKNIP